MSAGSGYFSCGRQYVIVLIGMMLEEGTRACQCCMSLLLCFFLRSFPTILCYSSTLKHEQLFSQRIIETITKVVNHLSAASSIIVSFLIRTELAITVKIWSNVLRPEISIFHLNGSESAEEHLLEPLPGLYHAFNPRLCALCPAALFFWARHKEYFGPKRAGNHFREGHQRIFLEDYDLANSH